MFRILISVAIVACALAFAPAARFMTKTQLKMSTNNQFSKALGVAAMGIALAGPLTQLPFVESLRHTSTALLSCTLELGKNADVWQANK